VFTGEGGRVERVRVEMGEPVLEPERIPFTPDYPVSVPCLQQMIPLPEGGEIQSIVGSVVSMGNPHCVVFVDDCASYPVERIGPLVETHPFFPERSNVEFTERLDNGGVRIRTWERGSGETLACGTGASAVAVLMHLLYGHTGELEAELAGGKLTLEWNGSGPVLMTGPAEEVFRGDYPF